MGEKRQRIFQTVLYQPFQVCRSSAIESTSDELVQSLETLANLSTKEQEAS